MHKILLYFSISLISEINRLCNSSILLTMIICFLVAIVLLMKLCFVAVDEEGILGIITSKIGSIILVVLLIGILTIVYPKLDRKINKKNLEMYQEMMDVNQKMEFMSWRLSIDSDYAKEIRLYNMQGMIYRESKKLSIDIIEFYQKFWKVMRKFLMTTSFLSDFVLLVAYYHRSSFFFRSKSFLSTGITSGFKHKTTALKFCFQCCFSIYKLYFILTKFKCIIFYVNFFIAY